MNLLILDHLALLFKDKEKERLEVYEATQKDVIILIYILGL